MLESVRNINLGWMFSLIGFVMTISGLSMTEGNKKGKTLLCFDEGCIYVQGLSNILLGIFFIALGIYMIQKNR